MEGSQGNQVEAAALRMSQPHWMDIPVVPVPGVLGVPGSAGWLPKFVLAAAAVVGEQH